MSRKWAVTEQSTAEGVYTIRLNRPEKRNAFSPELYHELKHGVLTAAGREDVDIVVIEGAGGAFAAGGDLATFLDLLSLPDDEFIPAYHAAFVEPLPFRAILECPKPVIAKIDGLCVAGGCLVACAADIAVATHRSTFGIPEARVGLADPYAPAMLPLAIGLPRARWMMMTAAMIDGRKAADWGLILESVEDQAELDDAVVRHINALRSTSPEGRWAYKQFTNRVIPHMSAEAVMRPAMSANGRVGLAAFVAKQKPDWERGSVL